MFKTCVLARPSPCHRNASILAGAKGSQYPKCPGPEACQLKLKHPPNGKDAESEFCLGCGACEQERLTGEKVKAPAAPDAGGMGWVPGLALVAHHPPYARRGGRGRRGKRGRGY